MSSPAKFRHLLNPAFLLIVIGIQLGFVVTEVVARPLADYHQNIKQAVGALETMLLPEEEQTAAEFESEFGDSLATIRTALPENETVEIEGEVVNVDNSWLHQALDELIHLGDRQTKRDQILLSLRALEARVAERESPASLREDKQQARNRIESILARPEYVSQKRRPNALAQFMRDLVRWLSKLFPEARDVNTGQINSISLIFQIIVVTLAVLLILYVANQLWRRLFSGVRKNKKVKKREARIVLGERLEPETSAADLLAAAEALARQGDIRAAIRKTYIALLVELGDRKLISLAHHKTNRDYLNSLRGMPPLHTRMTGLTESFERHWYGFASATANDWSDFRANYLAALQSGQ